LKGFGHRGPQEMELAEPRWREAPSTLPAATPSHAVAEAKTSDAGERLSTLAREAKLSAGQLKNLQQQLANLQTYMGLRETSKHYFMLGYGMIRRALVEIGRRSSLGADVFYLVPGELPRLLGGEDFAALTSQRRRQRKILLSLDVPAVLFSDDLEAIGRPLEISGAAELSGTAVSAGTIEGLALVLDEPAAAAEVADGFILVCPSTDPAWVPLFLRAGGLVMETGGILSHGAIVAREFGLPAVVGIANVQRQIRTGQRIRVDGNTGKVHVFD
jgi:pyruvate,water dikinase